MDIFFFAITNALSILTCGLFLFGIKDRKSSMIEIVIRATAIGVLFALTHVSVVMSVGASDRINGIYIGSFLLLSILGCFIAIFSTERRSIKVRNVYVSGILVSFNILAVDYGMTWYLFQESISIKSSQVVLAVTIVFGTTLSALRLLTQLANEAASSKLFQWKALGSLFAGLALGGVPYLVIATVHVPDPYMAEHFFYNTSPFVPYCFAAVLLLCLAVLPSVYGERKVVDTTIELQDSDQNQRSVFEHHPSPVFLIDCAGCIQDMNAEAEKMEQASREHILYRRFTSFFPADYQASAARQIELVLAGDAGRFETVMLTPSREEREVIITFVPLYNKGVVTGAYGIIKDVTEAKKAERQVHYLAEHDELTALPNRRSFLRDLRSLEQKFESHGCSFAVAFLDIDRFKKLNDLFGHAFGDRLIQEVAQRIQNVLPEGSRLYRMGGDEFTLLILDAEEEVTPLLQQIIDVVALPISIDHVECSVTCSIGLARCPENGTDGATLVKSADAAMYYAKMSGKNRYKMYTEELAKSQEQRLQLEQDLPEALEQGQFVLYYQPKFSLEENRVNSVEALIRWNHPALGLLLPGEFISIAEETGLIVYMERWALMKACRQVRI